MRLLSSTVAVVAAVAIAGVPAGASLIAGTGAGPAQVQARDGNGPPDHAKAYGFRGELPPRPAKAERAERAGGPEKDAAGRPEHRWARVVPGRHARQMRAWSACVRDHDGDKATCEKPMPPGLLKKLP